MKNILQPMKKDMKRIFILAMTVSMACGVSHLTFAGFKDPLELPASETTRLAERPMQALAKAGSALVAVGLRGLIILSEDGVQWQQSRSPVQSDLLAVNFPNDRQGWAVGHDGVILHSSDGGLSWEKQFDGKQAKDSFTKYYQSRLKPEGPERDAILAAIEANYAAGPSLPLLDVWFEDAQNGFAVGSFGTLLATQDGGLHWEPWLDRIDNEELLNLNGIQGINGDIYIAAERGVVFKLNRQGAHFERIETGYDGSFFGLLGCNEVVLAYGLSGGLYRSTDYGQNWSAVETSSKVTLTAGISLPDVNTFVLVNGRGELLIGDAGSNRLTLKKSKRSARYTGIVKQTDGHFLMTSLEGIRTEPAGSFSVHR